MPVTDSELKYILRGFVEKAAVAKVTKGSLLHQLRGKMENKHLGKMDRLHLTRISGRVNGRRNSIARWSDDFSL